MKPDYLKRNLPAACVLAIVVVVCMVAAPARGVTERATERTSNASGGHARLVGTRSVTSTIRAVFGRYGRQALRVARCESHLNPRALGAAGERGIFQIHPVHFRWLDEDRLWQPYYNARVAYRMSRGGRDWRAWTCQP